MKFQASMGTEASGTNSEDRVHVVERDEGFLVAVADGAGGTGGGGEAADAAMRAILKEASTSDAVAWVRCLAEIDRRLFESGAGGETTAVVAYMTEDAIVGASVGDSGAWFVTARDVENLTRRQQRKPLLGSGVAVPVLFEFGKGEGTLLVATDGLLKYAPAEKIGDEVRRRPLEQAPHALIDLVRLRSGALQDDVAVALCRRS